MTNGSMAPGPPGPGPVPGPGFRVQHHPYHQQQHQQQQQQQQYHQPNMSLTDRCAGCNAIDVPLLACDDLDGASNNKDGVPPVGDLSLRSRYVYSQFKRDIYTYIYVYISSCYPFFVLLMINNFTHSSLPNLYVLLEMQLYVTSNELRNIE